MTPPDPNAIVFFVDRALGRHTVAQALRNVGAVVEVHDDHFDQDTPDVDWLPIVGARGWYVLTKDKGLRRRPLEVQALRAARLRVFALSSGHKLTGPEMAAAFVAARDSMTRIAAHVDAPFVAKVYGDGEVKLWLTSSQMHDLVIRPPPR